MDAGKLSVGQALMNKMTEILGYCVNNEKKLVQLHNENMQLYKMMQGFTRMNIHSQIPFMTPRQCFYLYRKMGWTLDDISAVSGYTTEDVLKKIESYSQNN